MVVVAVVVVDVVKRARGGAEIKTEKGKTGLER